MENTMTLFVYSRHYFPLNRSCDSTPNPFMVYTQDLLWLIRLTEYSENTSGTIYFSAVSNVIEWLEVPISGGDPERSCWTNWRSVWSTEWLIMYQSMWSFLLRSSSKDTGSKTQDAWCHTVWKCSSKKGFFIRHLWHNPDTTSICVKLIKKTISSMPLLTGRNINQYFNLHCCEYFKTKSEIDLHFND